MSRELGWDVGECGRPIEEEAAGAQGQVVSLIKLTRASRHQCMDKGEQLKTSKQGNAMVHLAFLINHSGRCVGWLIGFQDRWLETTTQIRDDKGYPHSSSDGIAGRITC